MAILTTTEIIPLETDADGIMRISQTRVTLDTVVTAFKDMEPPQKKSPSSTRLSHWQTCIMSLVTICTKKKMWNLIWKRETRKRINCRNKWKPVLTQLEFERD